MSAYLTPPLIPELADWLTDYRSDLAAAGWRPEAQPGGKVRLSGAVVEILRDRPEGQDGHVDRDYVMWIGGDDYQLTPIS